MLGLGLSAAIVGAVAAWENRRQAALREKEIALDSVWDAEAFEASLRQAEQLRLLREMKSLQQEQVAPARLVITPHPDETITLEAVNAGLEMPFAEAQYLEATLFGLICTTEDMKEGTRAFLEKRAAKFQGK